MQLHVVAANLSGNQALLTKRTKRKLKRGTGSGTGAGTGTGAGGAGYLLIKIKQRRSVIIELFQEVDGDVSDAKVVPAFRQKSSFFFKRSS